MTWQGNNQEIPPLELSPGECMGVTQATKTWRSKVIQYKGIGSGESFFREVLCGEESTQPVKRISSNSLWVH